MTMYKMVALDQITLGARHSCLNLMLVLLLAWWCFYWFVMAYLYKKKPSFKALLLIALAVALLGWLVCRRYF